MNIKCTGNIKQEDQDFLVTILNEVDANIHTINVENYTAPDNFSVILRSKMEKFNDNWSNTCNNWINKFSDQTNSKWIVKTTYPNTQRIDYRKVYVCKENSIGNRNRDKSCNGRIDFKVRKVTEHTKKKDKLLRLGYNTEIKVIFEHTHEK